MDIQHLPLLPPPGYPAKKGLALTRPRAVSEVEGEERRPGTPGQTIAAVIDEGRRSEVNRVPATTESPQRRESETARAFREQGLPQGVQRALDSYRQTSEISEHELMPRLDIKV